MRHETPEPVNAAHIPGAGFMVDDTGGHKQGGFERGVVDHVENRRNGRKLGAHAEQQGNKAQLTHR